MASDDIQTRLQCEKEPSPAPAEPSEPCAPSSPTEKRPQFRRKRDKRRPRRPFHGELDKKPEPRGSNKGLKPVMRRKYRNPGLRQALSPKCLYSRPPEGDNETGAGNQGERGVESDGTSNTGSRYFELICLLLMNFSKNCMKLIQISC